jgi:hypothetical protein
MFKTYSLLIILFLQGCGPLIIPKPKEPILIPQGDNLYMHRDTKCMFIYNKEKSTFTEIVDSNGLEICNV